MKKMNVKLFADGERGWVGDNPFIWLDCKKINSDGWIPIKPAPPVIKTFK